jgi:hypothetical protein
MTKSIHKGGLLLLLCKKTTLVTVELILGRKNLNKQEKIKPTDVLAVDVTRTDAREPTGTIVCFLTNKYFDFDVENLIFQRVSELRPGVSELRDSSTKM